MVAGEARRWYRRRAWWLIAAALVIGIAWWPTSRFVGVNSVVSQQALPLWIKAVDFIDRDLNFGRLANGVLGGVQGDEGRALAAFAWTRAHIRPQPAELPTVDDHIWHIVIRGYGESDQQADVFTTLLAYQGVPAFWGLAGVRPNEIPVSYVRINGRWAVFDVARGLVFRRPDGQLASPTELESDAAIIRAAAAQGGTDADAYVKRWQGYRAPAAPEVSRADQQRPLRRLVHEARRLVGMEGTVWHMRPPAASSQLEGSQR